jgi:hypothetical protein
MMVRTAMKAAAYLLKYSRERTVARPPKPVIAGLSKSHTTVDVLKDITVGN